MLIVTTLRFFLLIAQKRLLDVRRLFRFLIKLAKNVLFCKKSFISTSCWLYWIKLMKLVSHSVLKFCYNFCYKNSKNIWKSKDIRQKIAELSIFKCVFFFCFNYQISINLINFITALNFNQWSMCIRNWTVNKQIATAVFPFYAENNINKSYHNDCGRWHFKIYEYKNKRCSF